MGNRLLSAAALGAFLAAGCEASKSSNPLSPSVAGPIAGVNITAPQPVSPSANAEIAIDQQPVTLTVKNSGTNAVRPLSYTFQVSADGPDRDDARSRSAGSAASILARARRRRQDSGAVVCDAGFPHAGGAESKPQSHPDAHADARRARGRRPDQYGAGHDTQPSDGP